MGPSNISFLSLFRVIFALPWSWEKGYHFCQDHGREKLFFSPFKYSHFPLNHDGRMSTVQCVFFFQWFFSDIKMHPLCHCGTSYEGVAFDEHINMWTYWRHHFEKVAMYFFWNITLTKILLSNRTPFLSCHLTFPALGGAIHRDFCFPMRHHPSP